MRAESNLATTPTQQNFILAGATTVMTLVLSALLTCSYHLAKIDYDRSYSQEGNSAAASTGQPNPLTHYESAQ